MTDVVSYSAVLSTISGTSLVSFSGEFDADAYDKIEAVIPHSSVETTVNVQPGGLTELQAMLIMSDNYGNLTFEVDAYEVTYTLNGPMLLVGSGNIGMLGATCNDLLFTNAHGSIDRNVTILVARTAIEGA